MGEIIDDLYQSNLGYDASDNIFEVASQLLKFEQKFLLWEHTLPTTISLLDTNFLSPEHGDKETLRYRFILTMRFLNVRILAHRPLLSRYLELLGTSKPDPQQFIVLRQVGGNSLRICAQSALMIVALMKAVLTPIDAPRHLLGAWWFSLYYSKCMTACILRRIR